MIKKQLPSMLFKRFSELSCNREEFAKTAASYNIALKANDYHGGLANNNHATDTRSKTRNRKRNIVWSNLPLQRKRQGQHRQKIPKACR